MVDAILMNEVAMSIVKRGNSKYWYIQFQFNGKSYIRSSRTTIRKLADQMEAEWRSQLHAQQYMGEKPRIKLQAAVAQFCESRRGTPNYRNLCATASVIGRILSGNRYLDELKAADLERFRRERVAEGVGPQTIKHGLNTICGSWKLASKLGYQVGPLEFPKIRLPRSPLRYLSHDEERRLLCELNPAREGRGLRPYAERDERTKVAMQDAYDLVILLFDTGARYSEVANVPWSRVDLDQRTINLWRPKVQNETVLYMSDRVHQVLARRATTRTGQYVFHNRSGGPRGYASQAIRKAIRRAGLEGCRVHTLRHTHASRLIQNGMSVYEVREILGHTDIKTTMRYAHLERCQVASKARDVMNSLGNQD